MEMKKYVKPELELLELSEADVLSVSFDVSWLGTDKKDYGYSWFTK